jgi:N-acetylneuraminate synthase (EC 2.5.1.56)
VDSKVNNVKIMDKTIGEGHPVYVIAEMSANHAGSIQNAKEIIHKAKECGADCIKIQTYTADTLTIDCNNDYFKIKDGIWKGENLYGLYAKAFTPWVWQAELKNEAEQIGLDFFSTPFDETAVDFLENIDVDFYKIASFELIDIPLIEYIAAKGKPIIMSTGMGSFTEIKEAVNAIRGQRNDSLILLKCSSAYPALSEDMNLRTIQHMKQEFKCPVGLSDHSMGSLGAITAVAMGATVIEKHFCLSRKIENPDASFSMEPEEFKAMVDDIRTVEKAMGRISYDLSKKEEENKLFRRSIFVVKDVVEGEVFSKENIRVIRPGHGMKPKYYNRVLNCHAAQSIKRGAPLQAEIIKERISEDYLQKADWQGVDLLYEWANDKETRLNSFNIKKIEYEEHKNWFKNCLENPNCDIYILYNDDSEPIGHIRLQYQDNVGTISYSIAPKHRGEGYGVKMIRLIEQEIKKARPEIRQLIGSVKHKNIASQKIFEVNGYTKENFEDRITFSKVL